MGCCCVAPAPRVASRTTSRCFRNPLTTAGLIASAGGQKKNPDWYYNLKAHPHCTLLVSHRGEIPGIAREAEGVERDRAWQAANTQHPGYAAYQQRTQRRIPVMMLDPEE
jgi:F420H(2)-dependent quinone reductase